ncbi:MAG: hypothetical protein HN749_00015 [Nitrospina sp.]|jgi:hypothetical protein|nr:hypothetical protein [Nitrospina sp.]MBT7706925.1 hypothetical protein [Nitrospina sp.]
MGFDLMGKKGSFSTNIAGWGYLFNLAFENGWAPEGTKTPGTIQMINPYGDGPYPEILDNWCGSYFSNDLQVVTEEDATNMANALDRSLEFKVSDDDEWLREFIMFARSGDFVIT